MGSTITKGVTFSSTETVTNTKLHSLVDDATIVKITDADGDTKIDMEESSDEDIIRFDIGGTQTVVFGDGTNEELVKLTNAGTDSGLEIDQNGNGIALLIDNAGTSNGLKIDQNGNGVPLYIDTEGTTNNVVDIESNTVTTGKILNVDNADALTSGGILYLLANSADTTSRKLVDIINEHADATGTTVLHTRNDSTGAGVDIDQVGNGTALEIDNDGTGHGLYLHQDGVQADSKYALWVYSNAAQVNAALVFIEQDNAGSDQRVLDIQNDGTGIGFAVLQSGDQIAVNIDSHQTGEMALKVVADSITTGEIAHFYSDSSDVNARHLVEIINDHADADAAECLYLKQDGNTNFINTSVGATLNVSGSWTDAPSTRDEKDDIENLEIKGFIDKLKKLNMYTYVTKREKYGAKDDDGNYPTKVKNPVARRKTGYCLDDVNTPEELIARDIQGSIVGVPLSSNINFLFAVCKELIKKVEIIETKIS